MPRDHHSESCSTVLQGCRGLNRSSRLPIQRLAEVFRAALLQPSSVLVFTLRLPPVEKPCNLGSAEGGGKRPLNSLEQGSFKGVYIGATIRDLQGYYTIGALIVGIV